MKKKVHRIKYFSKNDGASGYELSKVEELLERVNLSKEFKFLDMFEFYNIKLYFDNELFLIRWDETQIKRYQEIVEIVYAKLKERIFKLSDLNFFTEFETLDFNYNEDFWKLLNDLNSLKQISNSTILSVLNNSEWQLRNILSNSNLVSKYGSSIRCFMIGNALSSELLLSALEEGQSIQKADKLYFPKQLTLNDKEKMIVSYLESENPNLNYVRLIEQSKNSNSFRISPKTRLLAKKISIQLNNQLMETGVVQTFRFSVKFDKDQVKPFILHKDGLDIEFSYQTSPFDDINTPQSLQYIFKSLFNFTDETNCISMVSRLSDLRVLERIQMTSKNEYKSGVVFMKKEYLSDLQLHILNKYLKTEGRSIEEMLNFYIEFLNQTIEPIKFNFKLPTKDLNSLEKIRSVLPDFESFLKQYQCLASEGIIDHDLINIDPKALNIGDVMSLSKKMYIYSDSTTLDKLQEILYSDQSGLFYVNPFENKYSCLADLIIEENVDIDSFEDYQRVTIDRLINDGYLEITAFNYLKPQNDLLIYLLGEFRRKGTACYHSYHDLFRDEIDRLINEKMVNFESKLFSKQERSYLNFYLNKKEFTNGYDLRNKYLHGTNSSETMTHDYDYIRILKIIVLTLLKVESDLTYSNENIC